MSDNHTPFQWLKRSIVGIIGRERANRIAAPFHDWRASLRTKHFLASLPGTDLCVHLGCGYRPLPGWINVDGARGPEVDVVWDLREPLPFPANSCTAIFCEHVIEHLTKIEGERLVRECYRILQPSGVARFSTPDAERYLKSYATDRVFLYHPSFTESIDTPLDRVNMVMHEGGQHLWLYDTQSFTALMKQERFAEVLSQAFQESRHPQMQGIDSEERAFESLYIEALK